jgi:hypothetical protein
MKKIMIFVFIICLLACSKEQKKIIDREKELDKLYAQVLNENPFAKEINQTYREIINQIKKGSYINVISNKEYLEPMTFVTNLSFEYLKENIIDKKKVLKYQLTSLFCYHFIVRGTNTMIKSNATIRMRNIHWKIDKIMNELEEVYLILYAKKDRKNVR